MKRLRALLFWSHLALGAGAGLVILVMSATGAALAFKPQILGLIDRRVRSVTPSETTRQISDIATAAQNAAGGAAVTQIAVDRDRSRAVAVGLEGGRTIYVDSHTGAVRGEGSARAQAFFRTLENWHRWVGMSTENRSLAKSITGASNVAFLLLAVSGLYLWWPRTWLPQHTRAILLFRRSATGRARDFNWHNVIGFWCAAVILVMTTTALVMSYPAANDLLFRLAGSPPPSAGREGARAQEAGRGRGEAPRGGRAETRADARPAGPDAAALDRAFAIARAQMPTWSSISMRSGQGPLTFTLTDAQSWNAFARSQLTIDAASGTVQRWQPYDETSRGQKVRGWFRFAHTGELFGWPGQLLAGVACAGGVVLVWTGLSLAIRRLLNWASRRPVRGLSPDAAPRSARSRVPAEP
jgi:uncharacterized iron-regulated membrane protein